MGYQTPIVSKTIYLPCPDSSLTLNQYKEKYGIDLQELFHLETYEPEPGEHYVGVRGEFDNSTKLCLVFGDYVAPVTGKGTVGDVGERLVVYTTLYNSGNAARSGLLFEVVNGVIKVSTTNN